MSGLPMGSGLGTSSILAATTLRALAEMMGVEIDNQSLSDHVMRLEQLMTTGGGWQDQAGGIFPAAKLVVSGPGLHQRLRVEPVPWTDECEAEFERLTLFFYTGIWRVARDLCSRSSAGIWAGKARACRCCIASSRLPWKCLTLCGREGLFGKSPGPALGVEPAARSEYDERPH